MKQKKLSILVVEDDKYVRMGISSIASKYGLVSEAAEEKHAKKLLQGQLFDLAVVDMELESGGSGLDVLEMANKLCVHSIVLSSCNDDEIIEKAYNLGCGHFLSKNHYNQHLDAYLRQFVNSQHTDILEDFFTNHYLTKDVETIDLIKQISEINLKNKTLFITGETGTGKSLIGKLIHKMNFESNQPFVHLNCSEIPENLLEAELFGYKKGSFTGAIKDKQGYLEQSHNGVLFLDEIATMPMQMQQKLLKALDEKTFYPIGSSTPVQSSFTLISATCEDLFQKVHNNEFRKDLFFRITGLNLDLKPLRDRVQDIELLVKFFTKSSPRRIVIKNEALEALKAYSWPGNIRELKKCIDLLSIKTSGIIVRDDLPDYILKNTHQMVKKDSLISDQQKAYIMELGLKDYIKRIECQIVQEALDRNQGKISQTIKELKLSSSAFYRILEEIKK